MKIIEHLDKATAPLFSYEIVPPPRGRSVKDITDIVKALTPFNPPWIDVTAHSAGATYSEREDGTIERRITKKRPGTIGICGVIQNKFKIDTVTHLLCNGFTKEETEDAIIELNYLGIHNVLALRGDGLNYNKVISNGRSTNNYAIDLIGQIGEMKKGNLIDGTIENAEPLEFGIGVAGYPEKHFESPNLGYDLLWLKKKIDAGAEYVTTQMFFDNQHYFDYVKACREANINVPIIPGIKILKSVKQLQSIPKNFYINLPDELVNEIMTNPSHVKEIGLRHAANQALGLIENGAPCVHFYVMNDTESVVTIVKKLYKHT